MTAARCPTCDREECPMIGNSGEYAALDLADCRHHRVDWRARAIAAEADAARWRKVAPLIERLREAFDSDDALHEIAPAAFAIVAATEATP